MTQHELEPLRHVALTVVRSAAFVAVALAATARAALPPGGTFVDDDGNIHEGNIEAVAADGITVGCDRAISRYCPEGLVTRAQVASFLVRAFAFSPSGHDAFSDDDSSLHEPNINALAAAGVTIGCAESRFCPEAMLTRAQMAVLLSRAMPALPVPSRDYFTDDGGLVSESVINTLAEAGITLGCAPQRFCPARAVRRDEMASFLARALGLAPLVPPPRPAAETISVVPRADWGARPPVEQKLEPHSIQRLTVHHAGDQTVSTGPSRFRSWQVWHMDGRGWGDISYHYIVGVDGLIYEGRDVSFRTDTGTDYDTAGHFQVVVEGNFEVDHPSQPQLDSLARLLAWASSVYGIEPSTIAGHRDHAHTLCPGTHLHAYIASGQLADAVTALLAAGGVDSRDR